MISSILYEPELYQFGQEYNNDTSSTTGKGSKVTKTSCASSWCYRTRASYLTTPPRIFSHREITQFRVPVASSSHIQLQVLQVQVFQPVPSSYFNTFSMESSHYPGTCNKLLCLNLNAFPRGASEASELHCDADIKIIGIMMPESEIFDVTYQWQGFAFLCFFTLFSVTARCPKLIN